MSNLIADVRIALRGWRKSPGFAAIAILSIAVGIGANAAIFTLVDQILLRTLPVREPGALVQITFTGFRYGNNWGDGTDLSYPMYAELRDRNDVFDGVVARFGTAFNIGVSGQTERINGDLVSGNFFSTLGVGAALGRTLDDSDDRQPGAHPVAVLSHAYWQRRFAGDRAIVGSSILINGHAYTVIGVAREGFEGIEVGRRVQVFAPLMMKPQVTPTWNALNDRLWRWVRVFARLKPGVSRDQAQAALTPTFRTVLEGDLADRGFAEVAAPDRERYAANQLSLLDASKGRSSMRRALTTPLWVLMATAAGVLLIACANIANLLLARGAARQREIAVRLALGASRRRIVSQLMVESLLLGAAGGLLGVAVSALAAPIVLGFFVSADAPRPISTLPDWRILAFTGGLAMLTGLLFGLAPAFQSTRTSVGPTLKEHATSVLGGQARLRKALVAVQIALSLLLLIGAALFVRTLDNLLRIDLGFESGRLLSFSVDPSLSGYDPPKLRQFVRTLRERLERTPGVDAAGIAGIRLLEGNQWNASIVVEGYKATGNENSLQWCNVVTPGYFKAMGIPVLVGRDFNDRDERAVPPPPGGIDFRVAIVNERFARHYFGGGNPIGRRIGFGGTTTATMPIEIVGVVRDSKYTDVRDEPQRQVFFPFLEQRLPNAFTVYLRASRDPAAMFNAVRQTVNEIDPAIPIHGTRTLDQQVGLSLSRERMIATMTTTFGVLATLLAVIGLYGVMSFTVSRRTREIGVRVALGASARSIGWLVIREVLLITAAGIGIALPMAWWLGRYVAAQLYEVKPADLASTAGAVTLLVAVAILAGLLPSLRAARLSPTIALRHE
jgi:predicted permease